jgi:hypothetical protein
MPLTIQLTDERGKMMKQVLDRSWFLNGGVLPLDDKSYSLLRYINPYGNTVFNQLQMRDFLNEWQRLRAAARVPEEIALMDGVENLARECQAEPHLYLKFVGD